MSTSVKIMSVAKIYDGESNDMFIPKKAHESDAAYDVKSTIDIDIEPGCVSLIPAGFKIQLQSNYEAQIRPRSGNALKRSIMVANSPGTIDSGYRGEVGVILYNAGKSPVQIKRGDNIAQMVISEIPMVDMKIVDSLDDSDRGEHGFGSTGLAGK